MGNAKVNWLCRWSFTVAGAALLAIAPLSTAAHGAEAKVGKTVKIFKNIACQSPFIKDGSLQGSNVHRLARSDRGNLPHLAYSASKFYDAGNSVTPGAAINEVRAECPSWVNDTWNARLDAEGRGSEVSVNENVNVDAPK